MIRGLATGEIGDLGRYIWGECKMAVAIGLIIVSCGFVRVIAFDYTLQSRAPVCQVHIQCQCQREEHATSHTSIVPYGRYTSCHTIVTHRAIRVSTRCRCGHD